MFCSSPPLSSWLPELSYLQQGLSSKVRVICLGSTHHATSTSTSTSLSGRSCCGSLCISASPVSSRPSARSDGSVQSAMEASNLGSAETRDAADRLPVDGATPCVDWNNGAASVARCESCGRRLACSKWCDAVFQALACATAASTSQERRVEKRREEKVNRPAWPCLSCLKSQYDLVGPSSTLRKRLATRLSLARDSLT